MYKIKINNGQFTCPMLSKIIKERGNLNYGTCRMCKNNVLSKFVDDYVYCNYGSSSSSGGNSGGNEGGNTEPTIIDDQGVWEDYNP